MSNWTRAHDAWIAENCEGLEVSTDYGAGPHEIRFDRPWQPIPHYLTDTAAAIRAAEAWRKKKVGRRWHLRSAWINSLGHVLPAAADCWESATERAGYGAGDAALAQALYRATGGPA